MQPTPSATDTPQQWRAQHDRLLQAERLKDIYGGLPTLQMLLVFASVFALYKRRRRLACALGAVIVSLPVAMLFLPPIAPHSVVGAGLLLTLFACACALAAFSVYGRRYGVTNLITSLCALLVAAALIDLLTGSHLLRQAWMSYSVMETARFYGIGNEYMGVVIGAACVLTGMYPLNSGPAASRFAMRGLLLPLLTSGLIVFVLGYSRFGAKVGAIPSAGFALGAAWLVLWRGRLRAGDIGTLLAACLIGLSALVWIDLQRGAGEQSHLARAFAGMGGGGLAAIARRKLLLEGYLLLHSPWSAALLSAGVGLWWLRRRCSVALHVTVDQEHTQMAEVISSPVSNPNLPTVRMQPEIKTTAIESTEIEIAQRKQRAALTGLIAGAIVSLLCNDSGVTAAAMILLIGFAWTLAQTERFP